MLHADPTYLLIVCVDGQLCELFAQCQRVSIPLGQQAQLGQLQQGRRSVARRSAAAMA